MSSAFLIGRFFIGPDRDQQKISFPREAVDFDSEKQSPESGIIIQAINWSISRTQMDVRGDRSGQDQAKQNRDHRLSI